MSKVKEDVILHEVRRLFLRSQSYPKCFKTQSLAMEIHDFLHDNYLEMMSSAEVHHLFGLYTLLLCGLSALHNKKSDSEKILRRFSRYINVKGSITWEFIQPMFEQMINKDIEYFRSILTKSAKDADFFLQKHSMFRDWIFQQLGKSLAS